MDWREIERLVRQLRPYIDGSGLHVPDYEQIKKVLTAAWRSLFGEDLYIEPDSQDGQFVAVFALALLDAYQAMEAVYHSYSPQTAIGEGLSRMVKINGIKRLKGNHSTADVRIVGQPGTTIRNGVVKARSGSSWLLPVEVVVPIGGEIVVVATAQDMGPVTAQTGELSEIGTPTRGWQSVSNAKPATLGRSVESDADLRVRQRHSTALPSRTVFDGTLGAVASLSGVSRWRGYENDTNVTDKNGVPGHSICMVVEGGDVKAIATAIATKKTPGCGTWGDTSAEVVDPKGMITRIKFQRPKISTIAVKITVKALTGYLAATGEAMKDAAAKHVNGLQIGDDLLVSRLSCPILSVDPTPSMPTFDVISVQVGKKGQALSAANLAVGFDGVPVLKRDDVEVVVQS